jgi:hypothetical protein
MPSANGVGCVEWGMGSPGRNRHRPGLLFQQFEVLEHGARQLGGIVNAFFCAVHYAGCNASFCRHLIGHRQGSPADRHARGQLCT